jgi:periplasmic divalent cation tolerance protein
MICRMALSTIDDHDHAESIAQSLLEARLVACVNILGPLTSLYRWQGHIERDQEYLLIMKTAEAHIPALQERLLELHPYEVPEFLVLPVETGAPGYLHWITASVGEQPKAISCTDKG